MVRSIDYLLWKTVVLTHGVIPLIPLQTGSKSLLREQHLWLVEIRLCDLKAWGTGLCPCSQPAALGFGSEAQPSHLQHEQQGRRCEDIQPGETFPTQGNLFLPRSLSCHMGNSHSQIPEPSPLLSALHRHIYLWQCKHGVREQAVENAITTGPVPMNLSGRYALSRYGRAFGCTGWCPNELGSMSPTPAVQSGRKRLLLAIGRQHHSWSG